MPERHIDIAKLKADFRKAAEKRGIDPIAGSSVYQVANVVAETKRREHWARCKQAGDWWAHAEMWAMTPRQERSANTRWLEDEDGLTVDHGDLGYRPPHKQGLLIRKLEDRVFDRLFWQSYTIRREYVDLDIIPITAVVPLIREVLREFRAAKMTLKEIHHRQGYELRWIITKHHTMKMIRASVPITA